MAGGRVSELGGWLASLRFSGFTLLSVALLIAAGLILTPSISTYVQQQRELSDLRASVALHRAQVAEIDAERLKWQDPAYVRSQARGRLFYVVPGETQLSVITDTLIPADSTTDTSGELTQIQRNWARELVLSTLVAGTTALPPEQLIGAGGQPAADEGPAAAATNPAEPTPPAEGTAP